MLPLYEQYRPRTLDDVTGQGEAVDKIRAVSARGWNRVFWIVGSSGTGKTTLARIIADTASHRAYRMEMDAADLSIDKIRWIEDCCKYGALGEGGQPCLHSFIVNEAHCLRGPILARLNTTLELPTVMKNSVWVFTTTTAGERKLFDADEIERVPFGSRTIPVRLKANEQVTLDFAIRAKRIAEQEKLDGRPLEDYVALVRKHNHNMREVLQAVDAGEMLSQSKAA